MPEKILSRGMDWFNWKPESKLPEALLLMKTWGKDNEVADESRRDRGGDT